MPRTRLIPEELHAASREVVKRWWSLVANSALHGGSTYGERSLARREMRRKARAIILRNEATKKLFLGAASQKKKARYILAGLLACVHVAHDGCIYEEITLKQRLKSWNEHVSNSNLDDQDTTKHYGICKHGKSRELDTCHECNKNRDRSVLSSCGRFRLRSCVNGEEMELFRLLNYRLAPCSSGRN
uniref:Uncharacterized protein n=1 Tax=Amorphochlora amoebiformis TaxID=1561963 RepID=A0A7S0H6G8_9EUKA|mmetsp:Transcript_33264/g.53431  ORF Transcript_33264/g.53431 Transcript_33264/m.53431 type:complete len:187 (+) Transcript_33264:47-607(+)